MAGRAFLWAQASALLDRALQTPIREQIDALLQEEGWCGPEAQAALRQRVVGQEARLAALSPRLEAAEARCQALGERLAALEAELSQRRAAEAAALARAEAAEARLAALQRRRAPPSKARGPKADPKAR